MASVWNPLLFGHEIFLLTTSEIQLMTLLVLQYFQFFHFALGIFHFPHIDKVDLQLVRERRQTGRGIWEKILKDSGRIVILCRFWEFRINKSFKWFIVYSKISSSACSWEVELS